MSSYEEVKEILVSKNIKDDISSDDKVQIMESVHSELPLSLSIMACYEDGISSIDIDDWNNKSSKIKSSIKQNLKENKYYLFIKAHPKNFLVLVCKDELSELLFSNEFCYPFAVFPLDFKSFLMEDDSGSIVGKGEFAKVIIQDK